MLIFDEDSSLPLYRQVYQYFVKEIQSGRYKTGRKLPSIRTLCREWNLSKTTIERAYTELCQEGYVRSVPASGYVVAGLNVLFHDEVHKKGTDKASAEKIYNFFNGHSQEDFPLSLWQRLTHQALSADNVKKLNAYGDKQGEYELREEIAKYLYSSRGIICEPERIVMANGFQYALEIIAKLMPDDRLIAAMEEPGYGQARDVFINNRYKVKLVPVEKDGIDVSALWDSGAGVAYTTPSHQMPTGVVMSLEKRRQLLKWAEANDGYVIEDDYDHEFKYDIKPVQSMVSFDKQGRVIYMGTLSLAFSPALRMSYFVLPERLLEKYQQTFNGYRSMIPWLQQKIVSIYMAEGHLTKRINKMATRNLKKHRQLITSIEEVMGDRVKISRTDSGSHIMLKVASPLAQEELVARAQKYNVRLNPMSAFWGDKGNQAENFVILGFHAIDEGDIRKGIELLHKAWFG